MRAILALPENGKEYAGFESVCGYMNLVPPMNVNTFNKSMSDIISSYNKTAEESMDVAADDIRQLQCGTDVDDEVIIDTTVSSDGAWQKPGHESLNDIVTVIQNDIGNCIDYRVLSKKCNACSKWDNRKDSVEFEKFVSEHDCPINHVGSAGSMEANGVVNCFQSELLKGNYDTLN